jgi:autotransporter-associated beta strand protein
VTVNPTTANLTIGTATSSGIAFNHTLVLDGTSSGNTITGAMANGGVSSVLSVTKQNTSSWTLSGASSYTGATTVSGGILSVDNNNATSARLAGTTLVTVNAGGTLLLSQSGGTGSTDRINDSATMTLNGGTFNTGGLSEHGASNNTAGIGALTLQSTSVIDMGNVASIAAFANSKLSTWTGTLNIYNWSGTPSTGGGTDQLYFGSDTTGLTAAQLLNIQFYSGNGTGAYGAGALILANGEVAPVPEPSTYIVGILALSVLGYHQHRRRLHLMRTRQPL